MEWNDPRDIDLVSKTFDDWAAAVIAKDRPKVETFHDEGFRVRLGEAFLDKAAHVTTELSVAVREMSIISIDLTRRMGEFLLVWSRHLIKADHVPELPEFGLEGDWGGAEAAKEGFVQTEFTLWREEKDGSLKCVVFEARS